MPRTDIHPLVIPKWGMTMESATLADWLVAEGAAVTRGEEIVEIETEKIANAVESPHAGILRRRLGEVGQRFSCGALIGVIADASVPDEDIAAFVAEHAQAEIAAPSAAAVAAPQVVEVKGHSLRYLEQGSGGVPVLFIHGFAGDLNNWLFVQPGLAKDQATYAVDLPGHGGSGKALAGLESIADVADLLVAFLDQMGIERVHLVGHSMGGAIVLTLAQRHAGRVASMALINPVGLGAPPAREFIDGLTTAHTRQQVSALLKMLLVDEGLVSRNMVNDMLKYKRVDGVEAALRKFAELLPRETGALVKVLEEVRVPIQVIWGAQDRIVAAPVGREWPSHVRLTLLDQVGHMPHLESSSRTLEMIQETL